jgi:hypothetical protein
MIEFQGTRYRIIDSHTHWSNLVSNLVKPYFAQGFVFPEIFRFLERNVREVKRNTENRTERNMLFYVKLLDYFGFDKAIMLPIFTFDMPFSLALEIKYPERVVGFGFLNPIDKKIQKYFDYIHHAQIKPKGIKLHAEFSRFSPLIHQEQFIRLFEFFSAEKIIAFFHTGSHFNIRELAPILKRFPEVTVVLGHSGLAPQIDQAIACAREFKNVVMETSAMPYNYYWKKVIKMPEIGIERIVYGSDMPTCHPNVEMMKILSLPLSEAEKQLILADNITRILKSTRNS